MLLRTIKLTILIATVFHFVKCKLNKSDHMYKSVIVDIYNYCKCDSIILLNDASNQGVEIMMKLENLQFYLRQFGMPTIITSHKMFTSTINFNLEFFNIHKRLLNVAFDGTNDMELQLKLLVPAKVESNWTWLIFFENKTSIDRFFMNIYIPYQYKFIAAQRSTTNKNDEIISEIYRINYAKQIKQKIIAKWTERSGIQRFNISYEEQNVLYDRTLRAAICNNPPVLQIIKINNEIRLEGYLGRIMQIIQEELNFKTIYQELKESGIYENNTWTGGVGLIVNKTVDMLLVGLHMSKERANAIDFTIPILKTNMRMYIKKTNNTFSWSKYLKPFSVEVWIAVSCIIILSSNSIILIKYFQKNHKAYGEINGRFNFMDIYFDTYGAICGQAMESTVFSPMRIVQLTIHITTFLILSSYSAVIISLLTTNNYKPPFTTFEGFLKDGSYKIGTTRGAGYSAFQESSNKVMETIFRTKLSKQNPIPSTDIEGLYPVCSENKRAFLSTEVAASIVSSEHCTLVPLQIVTKQILSIGLQRNSPLREIFNRKLVQLKQNGVLKKLETSSISTLKNVKDSWSPIGITEVASIMYLLFGCMFISIGLLWIEIFMYQTSVRQRKISILRLR